MTKTKTTLTTEQMAALIITTSEQSFHHPVARFSVAALKSSIMLKVFASKSFYNATTIDNFKITPRGNVTWLGRTLVW